MSEAIHKFHGQSANISWGHLPVWRQRLGVDITRLAMGATMCIARMLGAKVVIVADFTQTGPASSIQRSIDEAVAAATEVKAEDEKEADTARLREALEVAVAALRRCGTMPSDWDALKQGEAALDGMKAALEAAVASLRRCGTMPSDWNALKQGEAALGMKAAP